MSPKTLATKLLGYRSNSALMVPGVLCAELGEDAMREALDRCWIEPNYDTGYLQLAENRLHEMRELSEKCCEKCGKDECECEPCPDSHQESTSRGFIMHHAHRHESTYGLGSNASTSGAMGSGQPSRAAAPQPQPRTPMAPNPQGQDYMVGEDVVIADEGKSYQAKVAAKNSDGTYKLSFGPNRPVTQDRAYRREEMQRIKQPGAPSDNQVTVQR